jgi:hypothetical protein
VELLLRSYFYKIYYYMAVVRNLYLALGLMTIIKHRSEMFYNLYENVSYIYGQIFCVTLCYVRGPFEKFVDWRHWATVMQRDAVTLTPSYSGGGKVVVAQSSFLSPLVTVILK